jgi:hypothetical protein
MLVDFLLPCTMEDDITKGTIRINRERVPLCSGPYIPIARRQQQPRLAPGIPAHPAALPVSPVGIGHRDTTPDSVPHSPQQSTSEGEEEEDGGYEETDGLGSDQAPSARKLAKVRAEMVESFFANLLSNEQRRTELVAAEMGTLEAQLIDPNSRCPSCSAAGGHAATGTRAGTAIVATLSALHEVELRCLRCSNPSCKALFVIKPTQLACIPGSENAWTLRRTSDVKPLWFHIDLLSFLDSHHYHAKSSSVYSFVQVMEEQWLRAREMGHGLGTEAVQEEGWQPPSLPVSMDTVRRQIGDALREYQHLLTMCDNVAETLGLDGWPNSRHNPCSACDPKSMQVHFDLCFGLPMLRRGYTLGYGQPPNARLIVPNSKVQQVVQEQPVGGGQQPQQQQPGEAQQQQQPGEAQQQQQPGEAQQQQLEGDVQEAAEHVGGEGEGDEQQGAAEGDGGEGTSIKCSEFKADKLVAHDSRKVRHMLSPQVQCFRGFWLTQGFQSIWT